jgi:hypothetical protein
MHARAQQQHRQKRPGFLPPSGAMTLLSHFQDPGSELILQRRPGRCTHLRHSFTTISEGPV